MNAESCRFSSPLNLAPGLNLLISKGCYFETGISLATMATKEGLKVLYVYTLLPDEKPPHERRPGEEEAMITQLFRENITGCEVGSGAVDAALGDILSKDVMENIQLFAVPFGGEVYEDTRGGKRPGLHSMSTANLYFLKIRQLMDESTYDLIVLADVIPLVVPTDESSGISCPMEKLPSATAIFEEGRRLGIPVVATVTSMSAPKAPLVPLSFENVTAPSALTDLAVKVYKEIRIRYSAGPMVTTESIRSAFLVVENNYEDHTAMPDESCVYLSDYNHISRSLLRDVVRISKHQWSAWRSRILGYRVERKSWKHRREDLLKQHEDAVFLSRYSLEVATVTPSVFCVTLNKKVANGFTPGATEVYATITLSLDDARNRKAFIKSVWHQIHEEKSRAPMVEDPDSRPLAQVFEDFARRQVIGLCR